MSFISLDIIKSVFLCHYKKIMAPTAEAHRQRDLSDVNIVSHRLSQEERNYLRRAVEVEEIVSVVKAEIYKTN